MIKNIIFDIGNVLTYYTWYKHIHSFGFSEEKCERVAQATVKSAQWNEFDRGVIPVEKLIDEMVRNDPGVENEIRLMCRNISGLVERADYAIPWLSELKAKGYRLYYLSNFSEKAGNECKHALDFFPYMDGGILSYKVKLIKPQPEIYQLLLKEYDLKACECVFLDDMPVNIEAAKKQGIYGIVFTNREAAEIELQKIGVK